MLLRSIAKHVKGKNWINRLTMLLACTMLLAACSPESQKVEKSVEISTFDSQSDVVHQPSENFLKEMIETEKFSGVALVIRGDQVVHSRAYGYANKNNANRLDTVFHVGSVTKQFTAAAIMQLVEQGLIDLNASINEYLPERYQSPNWQSVLVRQLLSHTSGIEDYALTRDYYDVTDGWAFGSTADGMIREAMTKALEFTPDTDHEYSNIGYTLLGEIIEEQSGLPFADYIKTNLLDPLNMKNSRIHTADYIPSENEAQGMRWNKEQGRHTKDELVTLPVTPPDGGLVTTLSDYVKWIAVYRDMKHPRLSKASLERMTLPSIPAGSYNWPEEGLDGEASYGFGITLSGNLLMHEGFIVGYRSAYIYDREDDILIVIFTNNTTNNPFKIAAGLFELKDPSSASNEDR
jgi:CubicO group peptidase (beta-lactamase class C family)